MNSKGDLIVRPPWPDELPRILAAFPAFRLDSPMHPLVLVTARRPERIVGIAELTPPAQPGGDALLACAGRRRYLKEPSALDLLQRLSALASSWGATHLRTKDDLQENDPRVGWLERAGLRVSCVDELWSVDAATLHVRLSRLHTMLEAAGRLTAFSAHPLHDSQWAGLELLLQGAGLPPPDQPRLRLEGREAYDWDLSTIVTAEAQVVGAVLIKRHGPEAIVETRVVDRRFIGGFNLPNHLCLHRSLEAGLARGLRRLVFAINPERDHETLRMIGKMSGERVGCRSHLGKQLPANLHAGRP